MSAGREEEKKKVKGDYLKLCVRSRQLPRFWEYRYLHLQTAPTCHLNPNLIFTGSSCLLWALLRMNGNALAQAAQRGGAVTITRSVLEPQRCGTEDTVHTVGDDLMVGLNDLSGLFQP